ncbi:hypothetical protein [Kaarinaea lacus]
MRSLIAVACIVCSWVSTAVADSTSQFKIDHLDFDNIPHIEIEPGHHGEIVMDPTLRNLGRGLAPVYLYRLPDYKTPKQLLLTTVVNRKRVFSPIVVLLTDGYEPAAVVTENVSLHRVNQVEVSSSMPITVQPDHKYMLITTDPKIFGKQLSYKRMNTSIVRVYDGNNIRYLPVTTGTREENVVIANSGRLVLSAPYQDY